MHEIMDNPNQPYLAYEINLKTTQSVDPFSDQLVLGIASAVGLLVLVGSLITCICCARGNSHSRYRNTSSSDSIRDTVQLEDLLSKPTLADPESVFSEFLLDATLSEDCSSQTAVAVDDTTQNSRASSVIDSYEESRKKSIDKGGSKKYRKESRKKSNVEFNNSKNIYKKNSCSNQTLQNDLSCVSSKRKKVQNKLEHYDKKVTETLQQEDDVKYEKNLNMDKKQELTIAMSKMHRQQKQSTRKSSLEFLDTNRISSGSESVSCTSSARGSVCHDIGMPANSFRLQRPSIYPLAEAGSCTEGRRNANEVDACNLPDVLENPVDCANVTIQIEEDLENSLDEISSHNQASLHHTKEKPETRCCDTPTKNNDALRHLGQNEIENDSFNRNTTPCLQKSYSVDRAVSGKHQCGKLPDRISLNLQIDFHFPNQGQPQSDGPVPIVVCSPIAFNNKCSGHNSDIPLESDIEPENAKCCNTGRKEDRNEEDTMLKINPTTPAISKSSNTHDVLVSRDLERTTKAENMERNLGESTALRLASRMPFWVKNRLSEPVELSNLIEKILKSPRLNRRSFTIADFKSLKFRSFTVIDNNDSTADFTQVKNPSKISEQTERVGTQQTFIDNELPGDSSVPSMIEDPSNRVIELKRNIMPKSSESNNLNDENIAENISSEPIPPKADTSTYIGRPELMPNTADFDKMDLAKEPPTSHRMSGDYEIPTLEYNDPEVKSNEKGDTSSEKNSCDKSDEECDYVESDNIFENKEDLKTNCAIDEMREEKYLDEGNDNSNASGYCDEVSVKNFENAVRTEYEKLDPHKEDGITPRVKRQNADRSSMTRSSSLAVIPAIPFVPSVVVTSVDGMDIGSNQTFPKSSRQKQLRDGAITYDAVTDSDDSHICPQVWGDVSTSTDNTIDHYNLSDDVIMEDENEEIGNSHTYPKTTKQNVKSSNNVNVMGAEIGYSQTYPKASRQTTKLDDSTIKDNVTAAVSVETFPKSYNHRAKITDTGNDCCAYNEVLPRPSHQKARSADTTIDRDAICSQESECKARSADTTVDTNVASDDSDYDNPWDSLENAVKRASMKYHKRPSVAASSVRDLMLKSAEDLGRLIEVAEKRRRDRLNSTKSTCEDKEGVDNQSPVFTRVSPLRHTVKGVMFSRRGFNEELGGKPTRGKPGTKSLRVSKDDSVHNMKEADDSKSNSKSWKFHSPESKKKLKKKL